MQLKLSTKVNDGGIGNSYEELISRIDLSINEGRRLAVRSINSVLVATHWSIGRWIVEYEQKGKKRAEYGQRLMRRLSKDLTKRQGKGWGQNQLLAIRQFYLIYRNRKISHTLCVKSDNGVESPSLGETSAIAQALPLSWSHYRFLIRIEDPVKRQFYEAECYKGNWSVRQLDRQIQSMLYERTALSKRKPAVIQKANSNPVVARPEDEIRDPYVLDFLGLRDEYSESDLEDALVHHLESFLLELGAGFAFIARQKRFMVGGKHYRIDLLLYHRILRCLVLIDLKIGEFNHADAGQMNFYLNWAKKEAVLSGENEPVGIILCSGKNKTYVQYALGNLNNKIFVSNYKLKLPKAEDLRQEILRGRNLFLKRQPPLRPGASGVENAEGEPN